MVDVRNGLSCLIAWKLHRRLTVGCRPDHNYLCRMWYFCVVCFDRCRLLLKRRLEKKQS